jgi:hypothetical protein
MGKRELKFLVLPVDGRERLAYIYPGQISGAS